MKVNPWEGEMGLIPDTGEEGAAQVGAHLPLCMLLAPPPQPLTGAGESQVPPSEPTPASRRPSPNAVTEVCCQRHGLAAQVRVAEAVSWALGTAHACCALQTQPPSQRVPFLQLVTQAPQWPKATRVSPPAAARVPVAGGVYVLLTSGAAQQLQRLLFTPMFVTC